MKVNFNNGLITSFEVGGLGFKAKHINPSLLEKTQAVFNQYYDDKNYTGHIILPNTQPTNARERRIARQVTEITQFAYRAGIIDGYAQRTGFKPDENGTLLNNKKKAASSPQARYHWMSSAGSDGMGCIRNYLYSISISKPVLTLVNYAGVISGAIWTWLSFSDVSNGASDRQKFIGTGDHEGQRRAAAGIFTGVLGSAGSILYLSGKAVELGVDPLSPTALGLNTGASVFFGAGAVANIILSTFGIYRCHSFAKKLDEYVNAPGKTEQERLKAAVRFLRDKMSLSPEEEANGVTLQAKIDYLKRRTSVRCLSEINKADLILDDLAKGDLTSARALIATVKTDNKRKESLYSVSLALSVIALVAYILTAIPTAGVAPFALFCCVAGISLAVGCYKRYYKPVDQAPGSSPAVSASAVAAAIGSVAR